MDRYLNMGKSVGISQKQKEMSQKEIESLTPLDLRNKKFDGEKAKQDLKNMTYQNIDTFTATDLDPVFEAALENAESTMSTLDLNLALEFQETIEKCHVEHIYIPLIVKHTLNVNITHYPDEMRKYKKCLGHSDEKKSRDPQKDKKKIKEKLASDPSIQSFKVYIDKNSLGHRDIVISSWIHKNDVPKCDSYQTHDEIISLDKWDESDQWIIDSQLLDSIDCSIVDTTYGPQETRLINGKEITRPYWEKKQHLQCLKLKQNHCDFIKSKDCIFLSESCLEKSGDQCLVWEKLFKCKTRTIRRSSGIQEIYGSDSSLWEFSYSENQIFPDVATKLAVFDEMKKELQTSNTVDVQAVHLFGGLEQQCSKSIASDIMYDCCSDMDGFAIDLKLSKCTADEIALAESRRKGLTHYIGIRKEKFFDLWVSRKEHVFCVFPSKLSRVFQEEARKQLNLSWGNPEKPDCRGLTQDEIKKLDFSKLNLLEAFERPKEVNSQDKIKKIEESLKQRLEAVSCN